MKKILFICIIFAGCKKSYNCECNTLVHNSGEVRTQTFLIQDKKEAAISRCNQSDEESVSFTTDCRITNQ